MPITMCSSTHAATARIITATTIRPSEREEEGDVGDSFMRSA